jgi:hypothetical protein
VSAAANAVRNRVNVAIVDAPMDSAEAAAGMVVAADTDAAAGSSVAATGASATSTGASATSTGASATSIGASVSSDGAAVAAPVSGPTGAAPLFGTDYAAMHTTKTYAYK